VKFTDPPFDRRAFLQLKLGYLLAWFLQGPMLIFRDEDLDYAMELEGYLPQLRARVLSAQKGISRAHQNRESVADARAFFGRSIAQLKRAHRELVELAVGYTFSCDRTLLSATRVNPAGDGYVWLFDPDWPLGERYLAPPKAGRPFGYG